MIVVKIIQSVYLYKSILIPDDTVVVLQRIKQCFVKDWFKSKYDCVDSLSIV